MVFAPHLKIIPILGQAQEKGVILLSPVSFAPKQVKTINSLCFQTGQIDILEVCLTLCYYTVMIECSLMLFCSVYPDIYVGFNGICIHFHITERKIDYLHCWRVTLSVWSSCQLYCFPTTDKPFIFLIQRTKSPRPHKMRQLQDFCLNYKNFAHISDWMKCLADH